MDRRHFIRSAIVTGTALTSAAAFAESDGEPATKRFSEQNWTIDNIIRANGIDWDQPRSIYLSAPCGVEANADFAAIRTRDGARQLVHGLYPLWRGRMAL